MNFPYVGSISRFRPNPKLNPNSLGISGFSESKSLMNDYLERLGSDFVKKVMHLYILKARMTIITITDTIAPGIVLNDCSPLYVSDTFSPYRSTSLNLDLSFSPLHHFFFLFFNSRFNVDADLYLGGNISLL